MRYAIWLDDMRDPGSRFYEICIQMKIDTIIRCYTGEAAIETLMAIDCAPLFISFDHDLGEGATGYDVAKWIAARNHMRDYCYLRSEFIFWVHSQNAVGAKNIHETMHATLHNTICTEFPI